MDAAGAASSGTGRADLLAFVGPFLSATGPDLQFVVLREVEREIVQYLVGLLRSQKRVELHGIVYDGYLPCLRVLKPAEERSLRQLG